MESYIICANGCDLTNKPRVACESFFIAKKNSRKSSVCVTPNAQIVNSKYKKIREQPGRSGKRKTKTRASDTDKSTHSPGNTDSAHWCRTDGWTDRRRRELPHLHLHEDLANGRVVCREVEGCWIDEVGKTDSLHGRN